MAAFFQQIPNLWLLKDFVPRRPHLDFIFVAPIKAIGNDAVFSRRLSGQNTGLTGPSDRGKGMLNGAKVARFSKSTDVFHAGKIFSAQAGYG